MRRLLSAAALAALSLAARAAPPASVGAEGVPLKAGDTVTFDLSALPDRFEGEAVATCTGTRISAVGPVAARCDRTFRFEMTPGGARMAYVFRGRDGERRIELPLARDARPVTFVAPSDGLLVPPPPTLLAAEDAERAARAAARDRCDGCRGEGFRLEEVKVTRPPGPPGGALPIRIGVLSPAGGAPPRR